MNVYYSINIFIWLSALSKVEINYTVPFYSLSFIIITIAGNILFNENVNLVRISGILIICIGVYLISRNT